MDGHMAKSIDLTVPLRFLAQTLEDNDGERQGRERPIFRHGNRQPRQWREQPIACMRPLYS